MAKKKQKAETAVAQSDSAQKATSKKRPGTKHGAKKGKAFERFVAQEIGHIFPDAQRMLEYQGSNVIGTDLENTDVFRFQCKCTANYANPSKIFEIREKDPNHIPVLVTKGNNRPAMAVVPFDKFVTLLEIAYGHSERFINPYVTDKVTTPLLEAKELPKLSNSLPLLGTQLELVKGLGVLDAEFREVTVAEQSGGGVHNISPSSFI